jgi:hypothetical protein
MSWYPARVFGVRKPCPYSLFRMSGQGSHAVLIRSMESQSARLRHSLENRLWLVSFGVQGGKQAVARRTIFLSQGSVNLATV